MSLKIKYSILGLALWLLLFLGWEWWRSYPKVRFTPISFADNRDTKIDSLLIQSLTNFLIPGVAVGIIQNQKVTYLKAFGYENLETKDSLTLQSIIPVASISKIFTALSLANFAMENGISIDTSFNSLLTKNQRLPSEFDSISLRALLTHTSGLSDKGKLNNLLIGEKKRKLKNISENLKSPAENKEFQYSDVNFDLIGYVLETRNKVAFEKVLKENILLDGGMEHSYFISQNSEDSLAIRGYEQTFLWKRMQSTKLKFNRFPSPSSGLVVTPLDLSKALLHLCRGAMGNFSDEIEWLQTGSDAPAGFQKIILNETEFIGHFGGFGGFSSILLFSPELETGIFLLSNAQDNTNFRQTISTEILRIISD